MNSQRVAETGADLAGQSADLVGKPMKRTDGKQFVTGEAKYTGDLSFGNEAHLAVARADEAHARIDSIDASSARAMDGVRLVFTGDDLEAETNPKGINELEYGLAVDRVHYYGQPVVAVVADTKYTARDAAQAITVDYTPLDAVLDVDTAVSADSPVVHPGIQDRVGVDGNVGDSFSQTVGDVDRAFDEAAHVFERRFRFPSINGAPMEPHSCVADYDVHDNSVTVRLPTQVIHTHKRTLADVFGLYDNQVQVIQPEVGGGFGNKLKVMPHEICAVYASKQLHRPVSITLSRQEHLEITKSSFNYVMDVRVGVADDGTVTAWKEHVVQDEGAYHESGLGILGGAAVNTRLLGYKVQNIEIDGSVVYTNRTPAAAVRGTGMRQMTFAREAMLNEIADDLGIDQVAIRQRQCITDDECPYVTATGNVLASTGLDEAMDRLLERTQYDSLREEVADRPNTGIGVAIGHHVSSCRPRGSDSDQATVDVSVDEDGSVHVRTEATDMGTSIRTTITQVVADVLRVDTDRIRIVDGDTTNTPPGTGSHSSRSMTMMGSAAARAAETVRDALAKIAAHQFDVSPDRVEFADSTAHAPGGGSSVSIEELTEIAFSRKVDMPPGMGADAMRATATFDSRDETVRHPTRPADEEGLGNISLDYPCSCQLAVVSVDPATGAVEFEEYVVVDDVGRAVNPLVVEGQIHGGAVQSVGAALAEELRWDATSGRPLNTDFASYGIPLITKSPHVEAEYVEVPSDQTPGGWKGVAEGPFVVGPAAIANAVSDAIGVPCSELPLTPERVRGLLSNAEGSG
jgi:carbon-monoxide dehydrogenase large subunit